MSFHVNGGNQHGYEKIRAIAIAQLRVSGRVGGWVGRVDRIISIPISMKSSTKVSVSELSYSRIFFGFLSAYVFECFAFC